MSEFLVVAAQLSPKVGRNIWFEEVRNEKPVWKGFESLGPIRTLVKSICGLKVTK